MKAQEPFAAFVGIDWADREHAVCLTLADGSAQQPSTLAQDAEAIADWANELAGRFAGRPVAVCLEQSRGALIVALMQYAHLILYPINPKQLAKYRQSFSPSGSKDDPRDAELLCRFVREHHARLRAWQPDDPVTRQLRQLSEDRRGWVDQRTAASNRLRQRLKQAFPLILEWAANDLFAAWVLKLLAKFPTQADFRRASPHQLQRYLPRRRKDVDGKLAADPRIARLRAAQPLLTDQPLLDAARIYIRSLVGELEHLNQVIAEYDHQINRVMAQHPDVELWRSVPGAGPALAPRLAAAFGTDRQRFASAQELQALSGIAPIRVQSGRSSQVRRRRACPHFLRQTFHEFARCSVRGSRWAAAFLHQHKAQGRSFHASVRALAFKWQRILFRCWKNHTPYDEQRYLARLQARNSPLCKIIAQLQSAQDEPTPKTT